MCVCTELLLQRRCIRLIRETTFQKFGDNTVFTVKIVGAIKTATHRGQKKDLATCTCERNGVNLRQKLDLLKEIFKYNMINSMPFNWNNFRA